MTFPNFVDTAGSDEPDIVVRPLNESELGKGFWRIRPGFVAASDGAARWLSRYRRAGVGSSHQPDERHEDVTLDDALRYSLAQGLPATGGVMLHASVVVREGRAWVFCGKGGAGKTTIATELAESGVCFAVDRAVIQVEPAGHVVVHPTPFSDHENRVAAAEPVGCAGIVFIQQAAENRLVSLDEVTALKRLLGHVTVMRRYSWLDRRVLDLAVEIVSTVSCFQLQFRRENKFWRLLTAADGQQ